jgi:predicted metal-dependent peptidase
LSDAPEELAKTALENARIALRLASISLPHLAGLARLVRLRADPRVGSAGMFPSGLLVINPVWFNALDRRAATFVIAHELMHLALQTHARAGDADRASFNVAHDYVINAMLADRLQMEPPAGGLHLPGAEHESAESIYARTRARTAAGDLPAHSWSDTLGQAPIAQSPMTYALRRAGLHVPEDQSGIDVLDESLLPVWFPDLDIKAERRLTVPIARAASKALSLDRLAKRLDAASGSRGGSGGGEREEATVQALSGLYRPPWELALQRWMEAVAPGPRSFSRPSRRGEISGGGVLPGRKREGWTLNIVLDTSGSMVDTLQHALGAIATFCQSAAVHQVHILQCDEDVTGDEYIDPAELREFSIRGFGGSDMSPAMTLLANDPDVEAAIVITDGYIEYPPGPLPYEVLWTLTEPNDFEPPYGSIIRMVGP